MKKESVPLLLVFSKHPEPGRVKTRLTRQCSAIDAAWLAKRFLHLTVERACRHWPGDIALAGAPDEHHPSFQQLHRQFGVSLQVQRGSGLGERMVNAISDNLGTNSAVAIIGSDIPQIEASCYIAIAESLQRGRMVLAPGHDGGFYCLGAGQSVERCLEGVRWSTATVFQTCLGNLQRAGFAVDTKFPVYRDIDYWQDLLSVSRTDTEVQILLETVMKKKDSRGQNRPASRRD